MNFASTTNMLNPIQYYYEKESSCLCKLLLAFLTVYLHRMKFSVTNGKSNFFGYNVSNVKPINIGFYVQTETVWTPTTTKISNVV